MVKLALIVFFENFFLRFLILLTFFRLSIDFLQVFDKKPVFFLFYHNFR